MSKRPPSQPQEQTMRKRIDVGGQSRDQYEAAGRCINVQVQALSQSGLSEDVILAAALGIILQLAPSEACLEELPVTKRRELIKASPDLRRALQSAIDQGCYDEVMSLPILREEHQHNTSSSVHPPPGGPFSGLQFNSLRHGLDLPYRGLAVEVFLAYLMRNNERFLSPGKDTYYGRFCSIVQSSGTGKTRLMLELGKSGICVLYMNIRFRADQQGHPGRDDTPANMLTRHCATEDKYRILCFAFFAAIFKVLRTCLEKKQPGWYEAMCNMNHPEAARRSFFVDLEREFANASTMNVENDMSTVSAGSRIMNEYYQQMVSSESFPQGKKHEPRVVIAIDEAHVLHEERSEPFTRADVLLQTIKDYSQGSLHPVWVVFASTTSKVAHFASPQALFPSARVQGQLLFPPFTQLGWDQNAPKPKRVQPDEVAKMEHILRYGRPLWFSLQEGYEPFHIHRLAGQKLCGAEVFGYDKHQSFAVLAQRFSLDITFGHPGALRFVETLVASHLRVCIKTTENRLWSYTTYPPEPILSCAAASLLHASGNFYLVATLRSLESMIDDGLVEIGQIGELVSRFLWLLAKDLFVRKLNVETVGNSQFEQDLQDCQLVPVVGFLEFVFGSRIWETQTEARRMFRNAYINFSHWVSMEFDIRQKTEDLRQLPIDDWTLSHWVRTSAIQCCHGHAGQPLINKAIPMYFKAQNPGDHDGMSQILILDKAGTSTAEFIRGDDLNIAPGHHGLPYIAILVDLGMAACEPKVWKTSPQGRDSCLRIYACGLDDTTYPFLKGQDRLRYALNDLYKRPSVPASRDIERRLEDQVQFGKSSEPRHMNWPVD